MKNIICIIFLFASFISETFSQNGITAFAVPYPSPPPSGFYRYRHDLKIDVNNNVWVAFRDNGVGKFDGSVWTIYKNTNSSFPDTTANCIAFDATNNVWCATSNGLTKFDGANWTTYNTSNSLLPSNLIKSVAANGNDIWAGTNLGVAKYDGTAWSIYNTSNSGLVNDTVNAIAIGQQGEIWLGTNAGLSKYHSGNWTGFTQTNPATLVPRIINIEVDGNNDVWIGVLLNTVCKLSNGFITDYVSQIYSGNIPFYYNAYGITANLQGKIVTVQSTSLYIIDGTSAFLKHFGRSIGIIGPIGAECDYDLNGNLWIACRRVNGNLAIPDSIYKFDISQHSNYGLGFTNENYKFLDINNVKAAVLGSGDMHWDLGNAQYEVPKGSEKNSVFASALWIGGFDQNDSLHVAAMTYRQTGVDFWPGPIDTVTHIADSSQVIPYDRIWKVNRFDVEDFKYNFLNGNVGNGTYVIPYDMLEWPAHGAGNLSRNLAPFVDYNSDGNYNPYDGDYPLIKGDQMLYWVFNDNLSQHTETNGDPLGFEIHASAYAYTCSSINDSNSVLNTTTLYQYRIINRSMNDYDSLFIGLWSDVDLGNALDDYIGCDSTINAGFVYDGDNDDGGGVGYGVNPPMQNITILIGPLVNSTDGLDNDNDGTIDEAGERCLMNHFVEYENVNGPFNGNPISAHDFYNYLRTLFLNDTYIYDCDSNITNFMYNGVPFSSIGCPMTLAAGGFPDDRRFVMSSGPFSLASEAETTIDFSYVLTWDSLSPNGLNTSIARNTADLQRVKFWFDTDSFPSCLNLNIGVEENFIQELDFTVYPNPASEILFVQLTEKVKFRESFYNVIDLSGRITLSGKLNKTQLDISNLEKGLYFLEIKSGNKKACRKFVKN